MKTIKLFFVILILIPAMALGQDTVCTFNYQAVVRDGSDAIIANRNVGIRLSILEELKGTPLYIEQHQKVTSGLGLFDLEVGGGNKVGGTMDWMDIPWIVKQHYLRLEVDINGGQNYELLGESPIRAVPMANVSKNALSALTALSLPPDATININQLNSQTVNSNVVIAQSFGYYDQFNVFVPIIIFIGGKKNLFIDKIYSEDLCTYGVAIQDGPTGEVYDVLGFDGNGLRVLDVDKIFTTGVCTEEMYLQDGPDGEAIIFAGFDEEGFLTMGAEKIFARSICTESFLAVDQFGNPKVILNPNANPTSEYVITVNGNLRVNGILMGTTKQFVIDHPLDPEKKNLRHWSIESDKMVNIYSGTVTLDKKGQAWVKLPDWFEALNTDFTYQLTCIGDFANVYIGKKISNNQFKIEGGKNNLEVSWQVSGVRHDKQALDYDMPVEEIKDSE